MNKYFKEEMNDWWEFAHLGTKWNSPEWEAVDKLLDTYAKAYNKGAMFDARVFNIPKEEVTNLVYWRQLDAARNSVQMVGQANFSHNELQGCSCNVIQDMLHEQRGINWNDYETRWKRGVSWTKATGIDWDMPILKGEGRAYVDKLIYVGE